MPDSRAFSHATGARLLQIPLPSRLETEADTGPLHLTGPTGDGRAARPGVVGHRGLESRTVIEAEGVRVVSPADTWCDLAALGRRWVTVDDLVVAGDHIVRAHDEAVRALVRVGSVTSPGVRLLHEALGRRVRPRGKVMMREALTLIRPRVKSPMESRARLMFVRAGFPEPVVNMPIHDEAGEWLAEGDLVWESARLVGEYQGAHHGDIAQRSADSARGHLLGGHQLSATLENEAIATVENEATQTDWMGDLCGGLGSDSATGCGRCSAAPGRAGLGHRQVDCRAGVGV
jgi:hypothetical protein